MIWQELGRLPNTVVNMAFTTASKTEKVRERSPKDLWLM